jgi:hypothetical protein
MTLIKKQIPKIQLLLQAKNYILIFVLKSFFARNSFSKSYEYFFIVNKFLLIIYLLRVASYIYFVLPEIHFFSSDLFFRILSQLEHVISNIIRIQWRNCYPCMSIIYYTFIEWERRSYKGKS